MHSENNSNPKLSPCCMHDSFVLIEEEGPSETDELNWLEEEVENMYYESLGGMNPDMKPYKGKIYHWAKTPIVRVKELELEYGESMGLGYFIVGFTTETPRLGSRIRTSWVVKHEGNEIETRNSRYTLVEEEDTL